MKNTRQPETVIFLPISTCIKLSELCALSQSLSRAGSGSGEISQSDPHKGRVVEQSISEDQPQPDTIVEKTTTVLKSDGTAVDGAGNKSGSGDKSTGTNAADSEQTQFNEGYSEGTPGFDSKFDGGDAEYKEETVEGAEGKTTKFSASGGHKVRAALSIFSHLRLAEQVFVSAYFIRCCTAAAAGILGFLTRTCIHARTCTPA